MRRPLVILAALSLGTSPAAAREQNIPANRDGQIEFMSPSGNIRCVWTPEGDEGVMSAGRAPELACTRMAPDPVTLVIDGDTGRVARTTAPQSRPCCDSTPLAYGNSWSRGDFRCTSSAAGLSCIGRARHGFTISRAAITVR